MKENTIGKELKSIAPWLGVAVAGLGLAFFCNPNVIEKLLRKGYRATFNNLVSHSNEKEDVEIYLDYIPDGDEPIIATWINDSMVANSRAIAKKRVKPHHVMLTVLQNAYSLIQSHRKLER